MVDMSALKYTVRQKLGKSYTESELKQWFDPLHFQQNTEQQTLELVVPHPLFSRWLSKQQVDDVLASAQSLLGKEYSIYLASFGKVAATPQYTHKNVSSALNDLSVGTDPASLVPSVYSFDNFINNAKNRFPLNVLKKAANNDVPYNPLIVHGAPGSGKTHLLQAVGQELAERAGALLCTSADELAALYLAKGETFLRFCASHNALLVDDMHRMGLFRDLAEFFPAIMDAFTLSGKLVLATSLRPPAEWQHFPQALKSRCDQGLIVQLHSPDMDIRLRYVQTHNKAMSLNLARDQMLILAQQCTSITRLIGVIKRLHALKHLMGSDLATQNIHAVLADTAENSVISPQEIMTIVASRLGVSFKDMTSHKRDPKTSGARSLAMYLCRELLGCSYPFLGKLFGGRDHSTVLHAVKKVQLSQGKEKDTNILVTELTQLCRQKTMKNI